MTTLKGVFELKPRHKRNFVRENIKVVQAVSKHRRHNESRSASLPPRQLRNPTASLPTTQNKRCLQSSSVRSRTKNGSEQTVHSAQERHNLCSDRASKGQINLSAKTTTYIDQENVPFEWAEICPSIISHTICHQSVQTDDIYEEKRISSLGQPIENLEERTKSTQLPLDHCASNEAVGVQVPEICCQSPTEPASLVLDSTSQPNLWNGKVNEVETKCPLSKGNNKSNNSRTIFEHTSSGAVWKESYDERDNVNQLIPVMENMSMTLNDKHSFSKLQLDPLLPPPTYQMGVVPKYLKKQLSEQKQVPHSAVPKQKLISPPTTQDDPNCPPGHVLMLDSERKETLSLILKSYNELVNELNKMPVRTDTLKMKKRKIELEKELDKLEEGIRVFSRSKVYVKLNA